MPFSVAEIAKKLQGEVLGDGNIVLSGFAPADRAKAGDLTFAENETHLRNAEASGASAVLVGANVSSEKKTLIRVANPRVGFARVLPLFFPEPAYPAGVHATAVVAASAKVDATAHVGPHCVVGEGVMLGPRVVLQGGNHVGAQSQLAEDVNLFPNVTIYPRTQIGKRVRIHSGSVVGSDGYGYVFDQGVHVKVPQIGNVVIGDDVEIGACVTIDRGALGSTSIGKGTKIDNLVQVAHNVVIGEHSLLVAQVGVAGSTKIGNYVTIAGQVGLAGHIKIGDKVMIGAKAGVMSDIPDGEKVLGVPAVADRIAKRQHLAYMQLPDWIKRVRELEKKVGVKPGGAEK